MKRFIAQINDGAFINIAADEMKIENEAIIALLNGSLVAYVDTSVCLCAHLSDSTPDLKMKLPIKEGGCSDGKR